MIYFLFYIDINNRIAITDIVIFHLMRNISVSNCKDMEGVAIISLSFVIELTNWLRSAASLSNQISRGRSGPNDRSRGWRSPMEVSHSTTPDQTEKPRQSNWRRKPFDSQSHNEYN